MDEENKTIEELLTTFPMLDFTQSTKQPVKKTLEEVLEEFPCLNYDYGTAPYYARKYPLLPVEAYITMQERFTESQK